MQEFSLKTAPEVTVNLRRSRRARRISLRVSSLDGKITLTMPPGTPARVGQAFAEEKAAWLRRAVGNVLAPVPVVIGASLPIGGQDHLVTLGKGRAAAIKDGMIAAPAAREGPAVEALLKLLARERLSQSVTRYANRLGRTPGRLTLRDTRSRWGSCSSSGNLMFSWRLIMAPVRVLDYVAAHEVAHLQHMDHSTAFWACVEDLFPDHKAERVWLRQEGATLHRFRFKKSD
ncbi:MAG: SprT family zinc-dependent metalloprotease [Pseudomonadota bacterium]